MQIAVLAGGLATRLGSITQNLPKSLIKINGRPFLEYQLEALRGSGVRNIVLCVGHLGEQIQYYFGTGTTFGVNLQYSYDGPQSLGTAGALKKAAELLEDDFFVMYGDSYLSLDFNAIMSNFKLHDKKGLMVVYRNYDRYERSNVVVEDNLVTLYSKTKRTANMICIDYGASILRKEVLQMIPEGIAYSLEALFDKLIGEREILAYEVKDRFFEIGSFTGLNEFEKHVLDGMGR